MDIHYKKLHFVREGDAEAKEQLAHYLMLHDCTFDWQVHFVDVVISTLLPKVGMMIERVQRCGCRQDITRECPSPMNFSFAR